MRRDDRDDPFDDIFNEIERLMEEMMGHGEGGFEGPGPAGFGADAHFDVQETDAEVRVVADIPGVEQEDITLKCDGEILTITVENDHRHLQERVTLPARVDEHSATATFNNGILEVAFEREDDSAEIDV